MPILAKPLVGPLARAVRRAPGRDDQRNGVTKDEIQAIIHQIAIYAGVPLAVECFRAARKVFAEVEKGS